MSTSADMWVINNLLDRHLIFFETIVQFYLNTEGLGFKDMDGEATEDEQMKSFKLRTKDGSELQNFSRRCFTLLLE